MAADVEYIGIDDDDDDDFGIFSISNDCHSDDDDALTDKYNVLLAVQTRRAAVNKDDSAEEFLLTRKRLSASFKTLLQTQ
uniref:Uncharacterized protein n=1 Tax=Peronospora matthiolae TaxID=2874970 RepID=A0AAV1U0I9_9STRA